MIFLIKYIAECLLLISEIWQDIHFYRNDHHGIPTLSILGNFNNWLDWNHSYNGFPEQQQYSYYKNILAYILLCKNEYTNSQTKKKRKKISYFNNILGNVQVTHIFHILSVVGIKRFDPENTLNCILQNIYNNVKYNLKGKYSLWFPLAFFFPFLLRRNKNSLRSKIFPNTKQKLLKINLNWRK